MGELSVMGAKRLMNLGNRVISSIWWERDRLGESSAAHIHARPFKWASALAVLWSKTTRRLARRL